MERVKTQEHEEIDIGKKKKKLQGKLLLLPLIELTK